MSGISKSVVALETAVSVMYKNVETLFKALEANEVGGR